MSWIQTVKGNKFDLLHPTAAMVDPSEVAHALARIGRYTGHTATERPYTVAQHCWLGSYLIATLLPGELQDTVYADAMALEFLVHDAPEAYTGDVSSPLKRAMLELSGHLDVSPFAEIERRVWRAVAERFRVPVRPHKLVHECDAKMLATEVKFLLLSRHPDFVMEYAPFDLVDLPVLDTNEAEVLWYCRWLELTGRLGNLIPTHAVEVGAAAMGVGVAQ